MKHQNVIDKQQRATNERAVAKSKKSLSTYNQTKTFPEHKNEFPQVNHSESSDDSNESNDEKGLLGSKVLSEIKKSGKAKAASVKERLKSIDKGQVTKASLIAVASGLAVAAAVFAGKKLKNAKSKSKTAKKAVAPAKSLAKKAKKAVGAKSLSKVAKKLEKSAVATGAKAKTKAKKVIRKVSAKAKAVKKRATAR